MHRSGWIALVAAGAVALSACAANVEVTTERAAPLAHVVHGLMMGVADSIPGISGGTIAFVVGMRSAATDVSFGWGLWAGMIRKRTWRPIVPRISLR